MAKLDLKAIASSPFAGFRHKKVEVPEWSEGRAKPVEVFLREPSAGAWLAWQEKSQKLKDAEAILTAVDKAQIQLESDVILFMSVLCDEDGETVFKEEDQPEVLRFYGPVHARLVAAALELLTPQQDIQAK